MSVTALIVAAGSGSRMGDGLPKQYRPVGGKPVLRRAIEALQLHPRIDRIDVAIGPGQEQLAYEALAGMTLGRMILGGETRADSVRNGLAEADGEAILVHDAARPFCPPQVIDRLLDALGHAPGAVPVLPVSDTLARSDGMLGEAIDRTGAVRVQTPQAFRTEILRQCYARWTGESPTDEASVVRASGHDVIAVEGDPSLEKLTTPADWARAESILAAAMISCTGMGFDVHGFAGEGPVMLGGIAIPSPRGLAGHSDADVALHAITDALLGASGLGDIGEHFPPTDPRWKGASSDLFLAHAAQLIRSVGGTIDHVDCTLICEQPRIGPYRQPMQSRIAEILGLQVGQVSVKATTTEGLGFTGRKEGIAAQAVATIRMAAR